MYEDEEPHLDYGCELSIRGPKDVLEDFLHRHLYTVCFKIVQAPKLPWAPREEIWLCDSLVPRPYLVMGQEGKAWEAENWGCDGAFNVVLRRLDQDLLLFRFTTWATTCERAVANAGRTLAPLTFDLRAQPLTSEERLGAWRVPLEVPTDFVSWPFRPEWPKETPPAWESGAPEGWYPKPDLPGPYQQGVDETLRYWDGHEWTRRYWVP